MAKTTISAAIEEYTSEAIQKLAEQDKRTFSNMVDVLLEEAVRARKSKK